MMERNSLFNDFKFNFPTQELLFDGELEQENKRENESKCVAWSAVVSEVAPLIDEDYLEAAKMIACTASIGSFHIKHLTATAVLKILKSKGNSVKFLVSESDLVPGIYEGGFKIWECALDLAKFLDRKEYFASKPKVLELGCGSGIPGILAYLNGCNVTFQDYNVEVLEMLTVPNVFLNTPEEKKTMMYSACTFVSGHWYDIKTKYYGNSNVQNKRYDVILTSETIYDKGNQHHLLELMKSALHKNGVIYLAAKTHYFGVGGTLDDFITLVKKDGTFESKEVLATENGIQRKIITMRFYSEIQENEEILM